MATETTPAAAAPAPAAAPRGSKGFTRELVGGNDRLRFIANVRKNGAIETYVNLRRHDADGKRIESSRGATVKHDSMDAAKAEIDKGIKLALKGGWTEKVRKGGSPFKARPDSFSLSNLPKPTAAK